MRTKQYIYIYILDQYNVYIYIRSKLLNRTKNEKRDTFSREICVFVSSLTRGGGGGGLGALCERLIVVRVALVLVHGAARESYKGQ